jgi:hypothetical protein
MGPLVGEPATTGAMRPSQERTARNEALWRDVNDRIDEVDEAMRVLPDDSLLSFHCECGREDCEERVSLTPPEYHEVRSQRDRFALVPGHENKAFERTVIRTDRYIVVDKLPAAEPLVGADGVPNSDP